MTLNAANLTGHTMLSIVIPAYNEEGGIGAVISRVLATLPALRAAGVPEAEIIIVDDGSSDRTAEIVRGFESVRLIRHARNRNYGGALKTGFSQARGDLLAFLDADGMYPPEALPSLCRPILDRDVDIVIGSRMAGADSRMPPTRRLGNFIFANLVSLVANRRVTDSATGMRVLKRTALDKLYPLPDGLNFTPVMSVRALHEQLKIEEVPITYSERVGRSKLSIVRDGVRFLNSIIWTALLYNPARVLGGVGLAGAGFAAIVAISLTAFRLSGVTALNAAGVLAVFGALVLGVAGVSLFGLARMFNYLVALFNNKAVAVPALSTHPGKQPLENHFWWIGGLSALAGLFVAIGVAILGSTGWDVDRMWLWLVGAALLVLVGAQLVISWVVIRALDEISRRATRIADDARGNDILDN